MATEDAWISDVFAHYSLLNDEDKNVFIDQLIDKSSFRQIHYLQTLLADKRFQQEKFDFFALLPFEIVAKIIGFLDLRTLCRSCLVCKQWNCLISNDGKLWKKLIKRDFGSQMLEKTNETLSVQFEYKKTYDKMAVFFAAMRRGTACQRRLCKSSQITAAHYSNGQLVVAESNRNIMFRMWSTASEVGRTVSTESYDKGQVTCVRLIDPETILYSTSLGYVRILKMPGTGRNLDGGRHCASIYTMDFRPSLDLVVTGSADFTVKLWSLARRRLNATLTGQHNHWVVKVTLSDLLLLSMDKTMILIWPLNKEAAAMVPSRQIPLHVSPIGFYTPGLILSPCGRTFYYVKQDLDDGTGRSECSYLCHIDAETGCVLRQIPLCFKVKSLMALGTKYACFVTPHMQQSNLVLLDLKSEETFELCNLPLTRGITPDHAHFAFCDTKWLDGFDGFNHSSDTAIIAVGCQQGVAMFKWAHRRNYNTANLDIEFYQGCDF